MKKIKIYGTDIDQNALDQFNDAMAQEWTTRGALMPDVHYCNGALPVGAVIETENMIVPSWVGSDIACGVSAQKLDIDESGIDLEMLKNDILKVIPTGHNKNSVKQEVITSVDDFHFITKSIKELIKNFAWKNIGTMGSGNHFLEIGKSENDGKLWIIVHSGSGNLGYRIAKHYMKIAAIEHSKNIDTTIYKKEFAIGKEIFLERNPDRYANDMERYIQKQISKSVKNVEGHFYLDVRSKIGNEYIDAMNYCVAFAEESRKKMIECVFNCIAKQKDVKAEKEINSTHNYAEIIGYNVIHRKGATNATEGVHGLVPGNMVAGTFIVKGLGNEDSLSSSSHGAGRIFSRTVAKNTLNVDEFKDAMSNIVMNHNPSEILDEAPAAYKNIFDVMEAQKDLVEIVDRSIPILNIKGV